MVQTPNHTPFKLPFYASPHVTQSFLARRSYGDSETWRSKVKQCTLDIIKRTGLKRVRSAERTEGRWMVRSKEMEGAGANTEGEVAGETNGL